MSGITRTTAALFVFLCSCATAFALTPEQCLFFETNGKTAICHAAGSIKEPFIFLEISEQGCVNGHAGHLLDYIAFLGAPSCQIAACLPAGAPCDATLACCDGSACTGVSCVTTPSPTVTVQAVTMQPGGVLTFLFPKSVKVAPSLGTDPGDTVVYTGQISGTTDGGDCATGTFPIQGAAIVDLRISGIRISQPVNIVTISPTNPIAPGTRLGNLERQVGCTAGGVPYDRFLGTVE